MTSSDGRITISDLAEWTTRRDASHRLGVSASWLTILWRRGSLRGVRTKLGWLYDPMAVEQCAKERQMQRQAARAAKQRHPASPRHGRGT